MIAASTLTGPAPSCSTASVFANAASTCSPRNVQTVGKLNIAAMYEVTLAGIRNP
jgi:hypothetical protein